MKMKNLLILLPLVAILTGCASGSEHYVKLNLNYVTTPTAPITSSDHNARTQIVEAANSVSSSLQELSALQTATTPHAKLPPPLDPKTTGLSTVASINWNGPVEPIVKRIAKACHYKVRVLGHAPSIQDIVNINAENQIMADILRNVSLQAEPEATIKVYPETKIIELRYNKLL